jgi:hypothetical protein
MANSIKIQYGTQGQAISISLANLATGSARQSAEIDNTSNLFTDALIFLRIKSGASGVSTTGYVNIWAFATANDGTNRSENAGSGDAAITLVSPTNLKFLGLMNMVNVGTFYTVGPLSVASVFGGILPAKWGIVVQNQSGGAFDGTEGNHLKVYQGIMHQIV